MGKSKPKRGLGKKAVPKRKKNNRAPHWLGNYPFKQSKRKPRVLKKKGDALLRIFGHEPHDVEVRLHVSTDKITCAEFRVQPGGYFDPPDIHSGPEIYYVLKGKATIFNPKTGFVCQADQGDFAFIREGQWHQTFNFCDEELQILTAFGRNMLPFEHGWPKLRYPGKPAYSSGISDALPLRLKTWQKYLANQTIRMQGEGIFVKKKDEAINLIHGEKNHVLVSLYIHTDGMQSGIVVVPARGRSDFETHKGDKVIYSLKGCVSAVIETEDQSSESVNAERYEVGSGEWMLIPQGTKHQYINYSSERVELLFTVAPKL